MRVLVTAHPLTGDPRLALALAAQEAGHEVVIAGRGVAASGVPVWQLGQGFISAGNGIDAALEDARDLIARLDERVAEWPPDLVVHDPCDLVAPLIGAKGAAYSGAPATSPRVQELMAPVLAPLYAERGLPDVLAVLRRSVYFDVCPPSLAVDDVSWWPRRLLLRPLVKSIIDYDVVEAHGEPDIVFAALAGGVPLVLTPRYADEQRMADLCARAGVVVSEGDDPAGAARKVAAEIAEMPVLADVLRRLG
ncbi:hypothetical protein [Actinokineospora inagensis]|uniref:hypothetical protein n=1 Tax=Actinokineospora inagensis TaxID=103730 RepID=UPI000410AA60|nr:hypothetical protein [Actinokineospora inagensis]